MFKKILKRILLPAWLLLCIPLIASYLTDEVKWSAYDYLVMGIILIVFFCILEFVRTKLKTQKVLVISIAVLVLCFLLLWVELSVGIFGSPVAGS